MAQTIDNQVASLKVQKYLNAANERVAIATDRLSSGLRVNSAKDDAAVISIAERMNAEIRGMNAGMRNAYDGISTSQVAEGGLSQVNDKLQQMRELALQSANGSNSAADRENLNKQFTALNSEISQIASTTQFNGKSVLADEARSINYQVGPGTGDEDTVSMDLVGIEPLNANINTFDASMASIDAIDLMIENVASSRADFGAMQTQFESTISNLQTGVENQSASRARIMDTDFAVETANLTRAQILQQAGTAMSSQANASPQSVMQLLG